MKAFSENERKKAVRIKEIAAYKFELNAKLLKTKVEVIEAQVKADLSLIQEKGKIDKKNRDGKEGKH